MGRGGGGMSSRSSGGGSIGGSRSSGGSRGGSSHSSTSHRGGFNSSRPSPSYSSKSARPMGGPPHRPPPPPRPRHTYVHHVYDGPYRRGTRTVVHHSGPSLASYAIALAFIIVIVVIAGIVNTGGASGGASGITRSTVAREKLEAKYVNTTDWYYDGAGWISSSSRLTDGMRYFYKETGVQPFLYITETVNGVSHPSDAQMSQFAEELYDQLFTDEGHLLVVFQEYGSDSEYLCWTVAGQMAKTVFDNEARSIFFDYIDYYYYSNLDEEAFFSTAFEKTADRMMTVTKSPMPKIIISIVILIAIIVLFNWWKKAKVQKNLEAEQTERILNADLGSKFSDSALDDLEAKYKDD